MNRATRLLTAGLPRVFLAGRAPITPPSGDPRVVAGDARLSVAAGERVSAAAPLVSASAFAADPSGISS